MSALASRGWSEIGRSFFLLSPFSPRLGVFFSRETSVFLKKKKKKKRAYLSSLCGSNVSPFLSVLKETTARLHFDARVPVRARSFVIDARLGRELRFKKKPEERDGLEGDGAHVGEADRGGRGRARVRVVPRTRTRHRRLRLAELRFFPKITRGLGGAASSGSRALLVSTRAERIEKRSG